MKPIIYATEKSYDLYLSGEYEEYDIWIRNVISKPDLSDSRELTFWQFTNREKLRGYEGKEKYIDVNVFHGSKEEFLSYPRFCSDACEGSNPCSENAENPGNTVRQCANVLEAEP